MGLSTQKKTVIINIRDCPARVTERLSTMLAIPGSPLIFTDSIVYYDEANDIAEGDILYSHGDCIGILYFSRGWKVHKDGQPDKDASVFPHISVVRGSRDLTAFSEVRAIEDRRAICVCYNNEECYLEQMYVYRNGKIGLTAKANLIYADELRLSTGYVYNKRALGFGSFVESGFVEVNSRLELVTSANGEVIKVFN